MPVTVLPAMGWEARIPLLQILNVLDQLGERKAFKKDQTRLSQVLEQIESDPERRGYYISQSLPRMQSRQAREIMLGWAGKPSEIKTPQTQVGRKYLWERDFTTGQWTQTRVPVGETKMKWGKARGVGPDEGWPEGTVIQESDTGQVKVLHAPKEPKVPKAEALGKRQSAQINNYTKAINQTLKKYGLKTGSILNPDGTINIESLSRNKKAIYEVLREKAQRGDTQATEDLSRVDFWYSKIDQLTGIGTPEFRQMRKKTQKELITHEFIPGEGLVPTGGR